MSELPRALGLLAEPPGPETARVAELLDLPAVPEGWQYSALFLEQLYPYASVYLDASGMMGGEARDLIAGFWRALGDSPGPEPDHLSALLGAYAMLTDFELAESEGARQEALRGAREAFLWDHLLSWLPAWLFKIESIAPPAYRAWGRILGEWLETEAATLGPRRALPAHFGVALPMAENPDDADTFLTQVLAPARTGFIITPTDLSAIADDAGLVLRAGERRYGLRNLLGQDANLTFRGLADLADRQPVWPGPIGDHWRARARRTAALLRRLTDEV